MIWGSTLLAALALCNGGLANLAAANLRAMPGQTEGRMVDFGSYASQLGDQPLILVELPSGSKREGFAAGPECRFPSPTAAVFLQRTFS